MGEAQSRSFLGAESWRQTAAIVMPIIATIAISVLTATWIIAGQLSGYEAKLSAVVDQVGKIAAALSSETTRSYELEHRITVMESAVHEQQQNDGSLRSDIAAMRADFSRDTNNLRDVMDNLRLTVKGLTDLMPAKDRGQ